jgi:hypothetical protein
VLLIYYTHTQQTKLGMKIPPCGLKPDHSEQAQAFANEVADGLEQVKGGLS